MFRCSIPACGQGAGGGQAVGAHALGALDEHGLVGAHGQGLADALEGDRGQGDQQPAGAAIVLMARRQRIFGMRLLQVDQPVEGVECGRYMQTDACFNTGLAPE